MGVAIEVLALTGTAIVYCVAAATGRAPASASLSIAALAVVAAAALAFAGRALAAGAAWPRGLVITWQIMQVAAAAVLWEFSAPAAVVAIVVGVATAVLVFLDARARPVRR